MTPDELAQKVIDDCAHTLWLEDSATHTRRLIKQAARLAFLEAAEIADGLQVKHREQAIFYFASALRAKAAEYGEPQ